jgi:hypothetical protein
MGFFDHQWMGFPKFILLIFHAFTPKIKSEILDTWFSGIKKSIPNLSLHLWQESLHYLSVMDILKLPEAYSEKDPGCLSLFHPHPPKDHTHTHTHTHTQTHIYHLGIQVFSPIVKKTQAVLASSILTHPNTTHTHTHTHTHTNTHIYHLGIQVFRTMLHPLRCPFLLLDIFGNSTEFWNFYSTCSYLFPSYFKVKVRVGRNSTEKKHTKKLAQTSQTAASWSWESRPSKETKAAAGQV